MHKTISAGVGERLQYIAHRYNDNTIRFVLSYPGFLDPDTLCAAARAVIGSVDVLHASYAAKGRRSYWRVCTDYRISDFFALAECEGDPMKVAGSIALQPIEHTGSCQMQVTLINGSDGCAVVVRISHLVVDGSDGKYLLNKLAESYRLIEQTGGASDLHIKNASDVASAAGSGQGLQQYVTESHKSGQHPLRIADDGRLEAHRRAFRRTSEAQALCPGGCCRV